MQIASPAIVGKSAYQYAVSNGYTGTEEEFAAAVNPDNYEASKFVRVVEQTFSDEEKAQARTNIGAVSTEYVVEIFEELKKLISEMNIEGAIAILDEAILDMCVLA